MTIGILVCTIGIIPIMLALGIKRIFTGTKLSLSLVIYMLSMALWQEDIGILYFKDLLSKDAALFLFRAFRISVTFSIPLVFYIACVIMNNYSTTFKSSTMLNKILRASFTKKHFYMFLLLSAFVYLISWTKLGIRGLKIVHVSFSSDAFYFPVYGPLNWIYVLYMGSLILLVIFIFAISRNIVNRSMKNFLGTFSACSLLLYLTGFMNFSLKTGAIASSIGAIIFSVLILFSFIEMNHRVTIKYHQAVERQKKLDCTGSFAGSLIHEVKNTNQVIRGFSKLLEESKSLTVTEKEYVKYILQSSKQIEDIANSYREYMKNSKMEFKIEDLNQIIQQSIAFSKELIKEKRIDIEFISDFRPLKANVNKIYLQQVFINLIKNSSEAMPADRKINKIKIDTDLADESIVINFYDTGAGIPPENRESIFDPFSSSKDKGMGLGLPFVKKIIFEHRGDITLVTSSPAGSHFQIRIPQFEMNEIETYSPGSF